MKKQIQKKEQSKLTKEKQTQSIFQNILLSEKELRQVKGGMDDVIIQDELLPA